MDTAWFKMAQRRAGVTSFDLGAAIGRDRSVISRLANGSQRMTLEQAQVIAETLKVDLSLLLEKAGMANAPTAQQIVTGFADNDTVAWVPAPEKLAETAQVNSIASAFGQRQGMDIWRVSTPSMNLAGMLVGDYMLVDTNLAEQCRPGDVVVARLYARNGFNTVLRRYAPPRAGGPQRRSRRMAGACGRW